MVDQGGGQQVQAKDGAYLGQAADVGAEAPRQQQHREQHQHGVDGAGVQVHDVPQGQGLPGGEKQGRRRAGQAEGVEHFGGQRVGAQGVPDADEQVDAAQVERQKSPHELPRGQGGDVLQQLVGQQQEGQHTEHPLPARRPQAAEQDRAPGAQKGAQPQPEQVHRAEQLKRVVVIPMQRLHGVDRIPERRTGWHPPRPLSVKKGVEVDPLGRTGAAAPQSRRRAGTGPHALGHSGFYGHIVRLQKIEAVFYPAPTS